MLKDLDQRHNEQHSQAHGAAQTMLPNKQPKTWLTITSTIIITLFIVFFAYLYLQNQTLIASLASNAESKKKAKQPLTSMIKVVNNQTVEKKEKVKELNKNANTAPKINSLTKNTVKAANLNVTAQEKTVTTKTNTPLVNRHSVLKSNKINQGSSHVENNEKKSAVTTAKVKSSISVSRRKVSAQHLAKQKMLQAEGAVNQNELSKAETLFEDVLVLTPSNKAARKQLAALWFGRKAYQSALNLLSQGIALTPQDSEFRLMQARIYLTQGYTDKAYQVLQALDQSNDIEYLLTLANIAQKLTKYPQAIRAYKKLANKQPSEGRWWLGLAVAYDSNSEYLLAINAYRSAITQGELSKTSLQFAKKRLTELGE